MTRQALLAALDEGWCDPSRLYRTGRQARILLDSARETVAACLGARPDEVTFTASGTRAAHLAVLGGLTGRRRAGNRFVHSAVEHSAVLNAAERHTLAGGAAVSVPVNQLGRVDVDGYSAAVEAGGVALAALMSANHEVGTLQPVAEVAERCAEAGVPLYVDAAQSVGRVPVPPGWSLLTASTHVSNPLLFTSLPYDSVKDFTPVAPGSSSACCMASRATCRAAKARRPT